MQTSVEVQLKKTTSNTVASCLVPVNEEVHYKIYGPENRLVFSKSIIILHPNGKTLEDLDISNLPAGMYTLDISTNKQLLKKIIITI